MLHGLTGTHMLVVLLVILLLFGAAKLPALARSMGQSARLFKGEMKAMKDDDAVAAAPDPRAPATDAGTAPAVAVDQNASIAHPR